MKILCPKCNAENETDLASAGMIQCVCGEWFKEPLAAEHARKFTVDAKTPRPETPLLIPASIKVKRHAESLEAIAKLCMGLGVLGLVAMFLVPGFPAGGMFASAGFGLALWFYLVAQIVHIRANTEK